MSEIIVNPEILARATAGFWVAVQDEFARERARDLQDAIDGHPERLDVSALPAIPAWCELPPALQDALQRHLADAVGLSALGYGHPKQDHYALGRLATWAEEIGLRERVRTTPTGCHRHRLYGVFAAMCLQLAQAEGLIVHLGHLAIAMARHQSPGEKPMTPEDVMRWMARPGAPRARARFQEQVNAMQTAIKSKESMATERRAG